MNEELASLKDCERISDFILDYDFWTKDDIEKINKILLERMKTNAKESDWEEWEQRQEQQL